MIDPFSNLNYNVTIPFSQEEFMGKTIKSKDLAEMLGISPATVSMVINDRPGISDATRQMVLDKLKEVGYDFSAKQNKSQKNQMIYFAIYKAHGQVVSDTPFFLQLTEGIESQAKAYGCRLQITYIYDVANIRGDFPLIHSPECKGIIVLATEMDLATAQTFASLGCPIVFLDSYFEDIDADFVVINNEQAARHATRHLIEHGHKDIGYLHSKYHINNFSERKNGYHKALTTAGLPIHSSYEFKLTPATEDAYRELKELLDQHPDLPTAFFADNDNIAIAAIKAFKESGCRVPEDISITSIDDIPMCEFIDPPLTTMQVPKHQLGYLAVKRLVTNYDRKDHEIVKIEVKTRLIERESVR